MIFRIYYLAVGWVVGGFGLLTAQQTGPEVISSAGYSGTGNQSWTVGEPVVETHTGTHVQLTQGFHQPQLTLTAVTEPPPGLQLSVYPNPALNSVFIDIPEGFSTPFELELTSMAGR